MSLLQSCEIEGLLSSHTDFLYSIVFLNNTFLADMSLTQNLRNVNLMLKTFMCSTFLTIRTFCAKVLLEIVDYEVTTRFYAVSDVIENKKYAIRTIFAGVAGLNLGAY